MIVRIIILLVLFMGTGDGILFARPVRQMVSFNRSWRFMLGDADAASPRYDDGSWQRVGLPHSFSMPYFLSKEFYQGYGWYRKPFKVTGRDLRGRVCLEFDGVFQEAEVFVNGQLAGHHLGGYTGFSVDMTPYLRRGENMVAVRVNNIWNPVVAPRGGEHVFGGGIYRSVRLVKVSDVHVRRHGTVITTPELAHNAGLWSDVVVQTEVENHSPTHAEITVLSRVVSPSGEEVGVARGSGAVAPHGMSAVTTHIPRIDRPLLWSTRSPRLYRLVTAVYRDGRLVDEVSESFGFRWCRWSASEGFFLNGEHLFFHGANVHQDQAGWGDAVTEEAARRDVRMMREAGFDMIRGSHYPHSPAFVDECDRQGVLFWSEAPFWGTAGPKVDGGWTAGAYPSDTAHAVLFEQNVLGQLAEMIREHRNHPSVFVWSMCNEPFFTGGGTLPGVRRLLRRMVDLVHEMDPERPAAIGGAQRPLGKERIDTLGDVAGYNGDGANIADFQQPPRPSVVSEYGSVSAERPGRFAPGWGDLGRDDGWRGRPWRGGQAIWCGFDHGSIFGDELGKMGIVDYFRIPKRAWYWYRQQQTGVAPPAWPAEGRAVQVRLWASKTDGIRTDGTDDVQLVATIIDADGREVTASPPLTLRVADGPGEFPTGRKIVFRPNSDILIRDGKAAIAMRAYHAGVATVVAEADGLPPTTIRLHFVDGPTFKPSEAVADRPYRRFVSEQAQDVVRYGIDSPTFVSSSAPAHGGGMATDGIASTWWQPATGDASPWLIVDTERALLYRSAVIDWTGQANGYVVELSEDREQWFKPERGRRMRYLRLRFAHGGDLMVREVCVNGVAAP